MTFSELSLSLVKKLDKQEKKKQGIFFTPPETIDKMIKLISTYMKGVKTVLEPSCGSGEFITRLQKMKGLTITGIEYNKIIFDSIKSLENKDTYLYHKNYLTYDSNNLYDLIIGNPPYFVVKKTEVDKQFLPYFEGRPNIFILFIIKSLQLLKENGILSFVLPKSFLNCLYYDKTRKFIHDHYSILSIVKCEDKYIDTSQETIIIIIQNNNSEKNNDYTLCIDGFTIFGIPEDITLLRSLYEQSTTLHTLQLNVHVGNIVWNQCKDILTDDDSKTLLIYSSDIKQNKLEIQTYKNPEKKNYICKKGQTSPMLVINRGYGVGKYSFNFCIINEDNEIEYLVENHLICITPDYTIEKDKLIKLYKNIIKSFEHPNTDTFIQLYFGNNAINTRELCHILPIYGIN